MKIVYIQDILNMSWVDSDNYFSWPQFFSNKFENFFCKLLFGVVCNKVCLHSRYTRNELTLPIDSRIYSIWVELTVITISHGHNFFQTSLRIFFCKLLFGVVCNKVCLHSRYTQNELTLPIDSRIYSIWVELTMITISHGYNFFKQVWEFFLQIIISGLSARKIVYIQDILDMSWLCL
jgi:hypothetical protein